MESKKISLKTILEQPLAKWGVAIIGFFLVNFLLLMGLSSKYDLEHKYVDVCVLSLKCDQHKNVIDKPGRTDPIDNYDDFDPGYNYPIARIPVKPLGVSVIAGGVSTGALVLLVGIGFIDIPIVLALATGALIGYGTYFGVQVFY